MPVGILGKKKGTTQIFDDSGNRVPVTVIEAGPCIVVQKKNTAKHKYDALQVAFEEIASRKLNKPRRGLFEKLDLAPMRYLREFRMTSEEVDSHKIGDKITVGLFAAGDKVDVTATSKGRGYQGVVKKFHMQGNTKTRGTHEVRRHPGSIGMCQFPGKIQKGTKLPGQLGNKRITTQSLKLIKVDEERNLLLIRGAVPGHTGSLIVVKKAIKTKAAVNN
jgi:large subunit ribosomal protein L3